MYSLRFNNSRIPDIKIKSFEEKYIDKNVFINIINEDYGPGTKLLGLMNMINSFSENSYIILLDDDLIYNSVIIEGFYNCIVNKEINVGSYWCYNLENIKIGQGSDCYLIKTNLLNNFMEYYNIIKNEDYVNYHDDVYISYFFYIKKIKINHIKIENESIYNYQDNHNIDALHNITGKYSRSILNSIVIQILNKFKFENKFDNIV
jgi:hypothetical protein